MLMTCLISREGGQKHELMVLVPYYVVLRGARQCA